MSRLTDAVNAAVADAVREHLARPLLEKCRAELADASRHYIRFVRAMLRAKELGRELAPLGLSCGTEGIDSTEADLVAAAARAVRGGLLPPDDEVLAGITFGA